MIKDRGGDFTRKSTTLACGGCCCCCCLQAGVTAYYFGKATHETARDAFGMLGFSGKVLAFVGPFAGACAALTFWKSDSIGMIALGLAFFSPLVLAALGLASWLGAAVGTILDLLLGRGKHAMHGLGEFGLIILWASLRSVAFGVAACIVSIPLIFIFATPLVWGIVPVMAVFASMGGWSSIND